MVIDLKIEFFGKPLFSAAEQFDLIIDKVCIIYYPTAFCAD